jgi:hypothetical protein
LFIVSNNWIFNNRNKAVLVATGWNWLGKNMMGTVTGLVVPQGDHGVYMKNYQHDDIEVIPMIIQEFIFRYILNFLNNDPKRNAITFAGVLHCSYSFNLHHVYSNKKINKRST